MLPLLIAVHTTHQSNTTHTFIGQVCWCSACFKPSLCLLQAARGIEKSLLEADLPAGKLWRMCTQGQEAGKENVGCAESHFCCTWVSLTSWKALRGFARHTVAKAWGPAACDSSPQPDTRHSTLPSLSVLSRQPEVEGAASVMSRLSSYRLGFALMCRLQDDPCLVQALDSSLLSAAGCSGLRDHPVVAAESPLPWSKS